MTLKNFEDNIPPVILERGYNYFTKNRVLSLEEDEKGLWVAEVEGTENYYVSLEIKGNKIQHWDCDCPFEGEICKHVTAVLYAISENELNKNEPAQKKGSKKSKAKSIESIFNKVTKEELKEFILSLFSKDRRLKNELLAYFAEYLDEEPGSKYKTIIKNIIKAAEDRYGFIDYRSSLSLTRDLGNLLNKAQAFLEERNLMESLAICKALIEEVPLLFQHMDDSSGGISDLMDFSFDIFSQIVSKAPPLLKDELFRYCIDRFSEEKYHDFDFGDGFLSLLPELITIEEQEKQFLKIIDNRIDVERNKEYPDYRVSHLLQVKVDFLMNGNRKEEARQLVKDNRQYPEFMEMIVDEALQKNDYPKAVALCFEGIKIAEEKGHPGTVNSWNEKLLSIYEKTKNRVEIRKTAKKLFFEKHFSMTYYKKLKSTYVQDEWPEICESIIEDIKGKNKRGDYYDARTLANIFVEENYKERLLKLLQINSDKIDFVAEYTEQLKKDYPDELILLYEKGIRKLGENTGRNYYNEVAYYLKKLQKINGGGEKVKSIVRYFLQTYKNRRAMREVLSKFPVD